MKIRCLTVEERARIVGMHQGGVKGVEIVATLGHPKSTVTTVLKEF
jgi:IS30 family transposase